MKSKSINIYIELQLLIEKTCKNCENLEEYSHLHVDLIKIFYKAKNVSIDHQRKRVCLEVYTSKITLDPSQKRCPNDIMYTSIPFINFGNFIKNCIDVTEQTKPFYTNLLAKLATYSTLKIA